MRTLVVTTVMLSVMHHGLAVAQSGSVSPTPPPAKGPATQSIGATPAVALDEGFAIGPEDVLGVLFWRDQDMSADVTVRPDGMITLPLLRDMKAAGLTPDQLANRIQEAAR